ncbi:MAG: phage portal protein [Timaviella obliquedivisa GSE-PSE-MK23-08B]|jgi:hypothetical protein|nr:phage portal protein [Timaviella obliquedivisa GSE-PSE-MK23-08B]
MAKNNKRLSTPIKQNSALSSLPIYPFAQEKSLLRPISNADRIQAGQLRRFSKVALAFSAIKQITEGVLRMPWHIEPPADKKTNEAAIALASNATRAIKRPNAEATLNNYRQLTSALIDDLLTLNYAVCERQPGEVERPFWLWSCDAAFIRINPKWSPYVEGVVPKFLDYKLGGNPRSLLSENAFMLLNNVNSYELVPPSPLEVAYGFLNAWLGLSDYQQKTTSEAAQEWLLHLGNVNETQLTAFRSYWDLEVVQKKKKPIMGGVGTATAIKIGASGDDQLYLQYSQFLTNVVMLAFSLTSRDANITEHDNRATSEASADTTFQRAIIPIAQTMDEGYDGEVIDFFLPGFRFVRDYREPRSEAVRNQEIRETYDSGLITRDEGRVKLGFDPLEDESGKEFGGKPKAGAIA